MGLPAGVLYRPLCVADIPSLISMLPSLLPGNWSSEGLHELLMSTHHCRVLCRADQSGAALLGFAEFTVVAEEGELLNLAIAGETQRAGLGRALLQAVLAELRARGCARCFLEVRRSNAAAIALYDTGGFVLEGVRKGYYPARQPQTQPEDALLYSLTL